MRYTIILFAYITLILYSYSQNNIEEAFNYTLGVRGLSQKDLSIPIDFFSMTEKSPTNNAKLLLPFVRDMMIEPMKSTAWLDNILQWKDQSAGEIIKQMTLILKPEVKFNLESNTVSPEEMVKNAAKYEKQILRAFTDNDLIYLKEHLMSIFGEEEYSGDNSDIFQFNRARDSSMMISKKTMDILAKADIEKIIKSYINSFNEANALYEYLKRSANFRETMPGKNDAYRIAIGGKEKNIYKGRYDLIIDYGGDDVYEIDKPYDLKNGYNCIIDLGGNDHYKTTSRFALAGTLFSSGMIFDSDGDDIYESPTGNLGAAIGGLGLILDEKGNDVYKSFSFSIGAGCFGVGLIIDREGNDIYTANSYSQGFGMTLGCGGIVDNTGNDSYIIDARSLDIGRYEDHYVTMSQGYALGVRPYYAGGVGFIAEGAGNDIYNCDIFGQGGAYWYGVGAIADKSGHDKYNGYQYAQGSGIHLAVGLLKDYDGWDFYQSNGVSQGCGHDFGFGMLWDVKGNDNYSAYSLSQGAGNANGIGIIVDESGVDGYLSKDRNNTRGYGNPRREYGSIGIFLDASGTDYYSDPESDSATSISSFYGVLTDYHYTDLASQQSGNQYKVQMEENSYTTEEYFIMAKTIEPRFSLWSELGYKKLVEDSVRSARYMLSKLGSEDHRDANVLRLISHKMKIAFSEALIEHLNSYLNKSIKLSQPEVSFAAYIFGETANPMGKEVLLKLTYDEDMRIRSSALNALGKIKYDTNDTEFINRVSERLRELAAAGANRKLYMKDLAFAFGNFRNERNIPVLTSMLKHEFYGVRFLAAENLWEYGNEYSNFITEEMIRSFQSDYEMVSFIYSIRQLDNSTKENIKGKIFSVTDNIIIREALKLNLGN